MTNIRAASTMVGNVQTSLCTESQRVWPVQSRLRWRCSGRRGTHMRRSRRLFLHYAAKSPKLHLPECCGHKQSQHRTGPTDVLGDDRVRTRDETSITWSTWPRWSCRWRSDRWSASLKEPQTPAAGRFLWTPESTERRQHERRPRPPTAHRTESNPVLLGRLEIINVREITGKT